MWVETMIPIHMLWLHGPRCPLFMKVKLIIHPPTPGMTWTHFRNYWPFVRWRGPVMRRFGGFLDFSLNKLLDKQSVMVIWNATTSMWRHSYADGFASTHIPQIGAIGKISHWDLYYRFSSLWYRTSCHINVDPKHFVDQNTYKHRKSLEATILLSIGNKCPRCPLGIQIDFIVSRGRIWGLT